MAGALVGDKPDAVALLLHHLAVARKHAVTGLHGAAEIAIVPGPGTADVATKCAPTDAARRADCQTDTQTGQAFALHKIDEGSAIGNTGKVFCHRGRSKYGEKDKKQCSH